MMATSQQLSVRKAWKRGWYRGIGVLGLVLGPGILAGAEAGKDEVPVSFELVSEVEAIRPGERFTVGLRLRHDPGWHTYWKNPGIVGVPTSIEWALPKGFRAGEIQWPQPEVVKMAQLDAYGYENEAVLLVDVEAPLELGGVEEVVLGAKVVYMACASSCHPGFKDLEMRLPVSAAGGGRELDGEMHRLFKESRATFAEGFGEDWKFDAWREGENLYLKVRREPGGKGGEVGKVAERVYFFDLLGMVDSSVNQSVTVEGEEEGFVMELATASWGPKDAKFLEGILYSPQGWRENEGEARAMKVRVPLRTLE
jgi:DsbC/DsbD-like thiol-disulfide interchange protein